MNSLCQCICFMIFGGVFQTTVSGGRGARSVLSESAMNPFITQSESRMFIKAHRGRRGVSCTNYIVGPNLALDCLDETICECNKPLCSTEVDREFYCHETTCSPGQICYLSVPCFVHYETTCTDDNCLSYPCVHGTCDDGNGTYTCTCTPGYEGQNCETETNECDSNPCQNGGTCADLVNEYTCSCPEDFTGVNCETDMCKPQFPTGADVIFLLDSSTSQSNSTFFRQIQYVKKFIKEFPIAPTDFQIALVTVSTEATVHFYLSNYTTESAVINAIDDVTAEEGASFTGKGLQTIREIILDEENGARSLVPKYVLVLTDGLFSDSQDATLQASLLDNMGVEIIVIGIGQQVLHMELMNIASHWAKVFPSTNNDAVNVIFIRHVMQECPDCYHSTSDVLFMIDSSSDVDWLKYSEQITALHVMLRAIPVGVDDVHVSLAKFADDVVEVCSFDEHFTTTNLRVELNGVSRMNTEGNITKALQHARMTGFLVSSGARSDTRKFVILVTSRDFSEDIAEIKVEAENLKESGVTLVTVAIDAETADHYLDIATDPAFVYILGNEVRTPHNVLYTLVGSLDYDVCESD